MANCEFNSQLDAYHDGELSTDARAVIESHVSGCSECSAQLAQLRTMSGLFSSSARPGLSQIAMHRLHHRLDLAMDRGLIRFGWTLSGIAASLLLVGSVWLMRVKEVPMPQAAPPWVGVSVAMDTDPNIRDASATPAAQWYLADAANRMDDIP
jgi:anti-sigma factor RsiW